MCSVAGSSNRTETEKMLEIMKHRSPNGYKATDNKKFSMGMGRLAIVDLTSPNLFPYQENGFILSFNGEIYNYVELKWRLGRLGHKFKTKSDTEILLKAWQEWGVKMFDKLNGMFAFAIYDGNRIILARDIAGEKPLYYKERPFKFASEAKALGLDCKEFPPASYGIYDFETLKISRYWELKPRKIFMKTVAEELESLLEDAVKLRTRVEVPYGLYFSGGIDSSLIRTFHYFPRVFSYKDNDYAEEFKRVFPKILWHLDYPVKSFSPFGLWKLAEMASKSVKVVISGEGADELFGGYIRYILPQFQYQARQELPSYKGMFPEPRSVNEMGWEEFNGNLRELLRMGDRMAAAFGLENRCPFLDRRVIEFAFSLPENFKIQGLKTKVILRDILSKRNPKYAFPEKQGLYCSVNSWLGNEDEYSKEQYLKYQNSLWKTLSL